MSETVTVVSSVIEEPALPVVSKLQLLGDAGAASCEGDFCEIPDHHEQAVVNRRLDEDAV